MNLSDPLVEVGSIQNHRGESHLELDVERLLELGLKEDQESIEVTSCEGS